tara:strand:- start:24 stop:143 length:120 start_codon:yes stop_codon:yes gene_type:complete
MQMPDKFVIMSEEERLRRKKLRKRSRMIELAYQLGLFEY